MGWGCEPERMTGGNVGGLGEVLRETLNAVCRETGGCSMLDSPPFYLIRRQIGLDVTSSKKNVTGGACLFCL